MGYFKFFKQYSKEIKEELGKVQTSKSSIHIPSDLTWHTFPAFSITLLHLKF